MLGENETEEPLSTNESFSSGETAAKAVEVPEKPVLQDEGQGSAPKSDNAPREKLTHRKALEKAFKLHKEKLSTGSNEVPTQKEAPSSPIGASTFEPPKSWNKTLKAKFSTFSPEEQKEILTWQEERDRDIQNKFTTWGEKAKASEAYSQIEQEYADYFKATNVKPSEGLKNLISADLYLQQDPVGAIKWLMESKGITLQHLQSQKSYPQQLNHQNLAYEQRLAQIEENQKKILEQETRQRAAVIESEVESFINAKSDSGEPIYGYLHDEELKEAIAADMEMFSERILKAHPKKPVQEVLKEAYTKAIRANDSAWAREQKKQEELRLAELQKKAKAAKTAGSSVRGSPVGSPEWSPQGKSRREIIAHQVAVQKGRA